MSADDRIKVAVACQGGGSHTAFTAGVLKRVLCDRPDGYELVGLSGTSGGAMCAAVAWAGLRQHDEARAADLLDSFWEELSARSLWDHLVNDWTLWANRLAGQFGTNGVSPYVHPGSRVARQRLREVVDAHVDFGQVDPEADVDPDLYVGAVNVETGEFRVFENGDGGVDALLASAAVPTLFRAAEVDGSHYWDGLFSQNPPIRHFVTDVDPEEKPDEIWVVRINPTRRETVPRWLIEILDRRNELAGNLSLQQERHTIETVNEFIEEGIIDDDRYKHIEIREVELDLDLDLHSKLDRDPEFVQQLVARGERHAPQLWAPTTETKSEASIEAETGE